MAVARRSIVAIHGVGVPSLGSVLEDVHSELSSITGPGFRSDIVIDGDLYPRLEFPAGPVKELVEVNWADIQRASQTSVGFLRHLVYILTSMLSLGSEDLGPSRRPIRAAKWYRAAFESILVWCIYPPVLLSLLSISEILLIRTVIALLVMTFVGLLATYLKRFSKLFCFGYVWVLLLVALYVLLVFDIGSTTALTQFATGCLSYGQLIVALLLVAASVEVLVKWLKQYSKEQMLSRLAFLYTPFLVISAIGALIWVIVLLAAETVGTENSTAYLDWQASYLSTLNYDLQRMEYLFGSAVFLIGCLAALGLLRYSWAKKRKRGSKRSGLVAQNWLSQMSIFAPIVLTAVGVIYFYYAITGSAPDSKNQNVLEIYTWSAMRAIPFIPFLIGPFAIVLDVLGDVLFYLLPSRFHQSTVQTTRLRLQRLLRGLHDDSNGAKTVVLSHSQGSVIALDVLGSNPDLGVRLITAGSPISSLYDRFLNSSASARVKGFQQPETWWNIYRADDYIGGPVTLLGVRNIDAGDGGHTDYWSNPEVARAALEV